MKTVLSSVQQDEIDAHEVCAQHRRADVLHAAENVRGVVVRAAHKVMKLESRAEADEWDGI